MNPREKAKQLIQEGQTLVEQEMFEDALVKFKESVEIYPTAEGYTYWAWMLSYSDDLNKCIDLCKQAIEVDPDFGNAYNDIGSYLIELEQYEDAIPWLIKAKSAKKTDAEQFPYLNLARAYLKLGQDNDARTEYELLLEMDPNNVEARFLVGYLADNENADGFSNLFSIN